MDGTVVSNMPFVVQDEHGNRLTYPSHSEADMALATLLAIKHGDQPEFIDAEFRESCLYRPKWERDDYRQTTIRKAIESAKRLAEKTAPIVAPAGATEPTGQQKKESGEQRLEFSEDTEVIREFDSSVVNGIYVNSWS